MTSRNSIIQIVASNKKIPIIKILLISTLAAVEEETIMMIREIEAEALISLITIDGINIIAVIRVLNNAILLLHLTLTSIHHILTIINLVLIIIISLPPHLLTTTIITTPQV